MLVTGPLWARKAWGVWWQWDARLTSTLVMWLIFVAYLLLRRYGGPGSEKLAAAVALFGMANVPFVYWSVNVWRTVHPKTTVVMHAACRACAARSGSASRRSSCSSFSCSSRACGSKTRRAELEGLFLALED